MNALKLIGIIDGVVMAALAALGTLYPPAAVYTGPAVIVLGTLGTLLSGGHAMASK